MSEPITYAKAGGPPEDWHGLRVVDLGAKLYGLTGRHGLRA